MRTYLFNPITLTAIYYLISTFISYKLISKDQRKPLKVRALIVSIGAGLILLPIFITLYTIMIVKDRVEQIRIQKVTKRLIKEAQKRNGRGYE